MQQVRVAGPTDDRTGLEVSLEAELLVKLIYKVVGHVVSVESLEARGGRRWQ